MIQPQQTTKQHHTNIPSTTIEQSQGTNVTRRPDSRPMGQGTLWQTT
jgi:hypothetical protein